MHMCSVVARETDDEIIHVAFFYFISLLRRRYRFRQGVAESGLADTLDQVSVAVNSAAQLIVEEIPQVQLIDIYGLTAVSFPDRKRLHILHLS